MLTSVMHKIQTVLYRQALSNNLAWMDTLSEMDELDALKETTSRLARIQFDSNEMLSRNIDLVLEIDSKTYTPAQQIGYKYLNLLKIDAGIEESIFSAVYSYQRQLYITYTQFIDFYQAQSKVLIDAEKMNLILARHLNTTFTMTKWRYFDDQAAPIGTWVNVCKVIKCAENLAILNTNLFMYDFQHKETSLATLLKQGFMMDTLHKGNYSRVQIQLTEQILKVWATNPLMLNKHKLDKFQFFINTESNKGPERIRTVEKFADYRFWKTTRLLDKIEAYLCAVDTRKPLQAFGLEKMATTEMTVQLFKKLRVDWCVEGYERQRRKEARNNRNKLISVSYGLADIYHRLNTAKPSLLVEPITQAQNKQNNLASENWWLVDESANGFSVDLGKAYSAWIALGKLIAYITPDDRALFVIAEIKSIRKQANGNYRAGLEVLGLNGVAVKLRRLHQTHFTETLSSELVIDTSAELSPLNYFSGVLLDCQVGGKTGKATLIMPKSEYKRGLKLAVNVDGTEKVLAMGAPLSKQHDWVRLAI